MDYRLAVMQDLHQLKAMYKRLIKNMDDNGIQIWDNIYPCSLFEEDIRNRQLYVLFDNDELVSAFALCETGEGEESIKWQDAHGKALYVRRFGVNVDYLRKGIGSLMLAKAKETAKNSCAEYLRVLVVDINEPALQLYSKNGFKRADGIYDLIIDDGLILHEYGYEAKL